MNLKIVTYNIHHGLRVKEVAANLKKLAAEEVTVFCLQELFELEGQPSVLEILLAALGDGWKSETFLEPGTFNMGVGILWKADVIEPLTIERLLLPRLSKFNVYETILERGIIRWVNEPPQRAALIGTFKLNGRLLRITNVHLDCHGHFSQRAKQLTYLAAHLKSLPSVDREIICGDFNTIGLEVLSKNQEKKIRGLLGPEFINAYPYATPTFNNLAQRLDYIFVKNMKVREAKVLKLKGSDHFPLVASLEII